jgi:hypothetical protein
MSWESPRGPISIDPQTREIVQNIYIRKVEKKNGELYNVEFRHLRSGQGPGQGIGAEVRQRALNGSVPMQSLGGTNRRSFGINLMPAMGGGAHGL